MEAFKTIALEGAAITAVFLLLAYLFSTRYKTTETELTYEDGYQAVVGSLAKLSVEELYDQYKQYGDNEVKWDQGWLQACIDNGAVVDKQS